MLTDTNRSELLEDSLINPRPLVAGHELRPLSAASFVILRRVNNPFVTNSQGVDLDTPEGIVAALAVVFVHAAPLRDVLECHRDPERFDDEVLLFAEKFPIDCLEQAVAAITGEMNMAAAAVTEKEGPDDDEEDDDPNGHGRRGSPTASSKSQPRPGGRAKKSRGS